MHLSSFELVEARSELCFEASLRVVTGQLDLFVANYLPTSDNGEGNSIQLDVVELTVLIHFLEELTNLIDGERHFVPANF